MTIKPSQWRSSRSPVDPAVRADEAATAELVREHVAHARAAAAEHGHVVADAEPGIEWVAEWHHQDADAGAPGYLPWPPDGGDQDRPDAWRLRATLQLVS